jgi:hypothetical protein
MNRQPESGAATLTAIMAVGLMAAFAAALALTTSAETTIAANFHRRTEAMYAAEAILEWGVAALQRSTDWNGVLDGTSGSGFADGTPAGIRRLADGRSLDLTRIVSLLNCGRVTVCTAAQMAAVTADRPWGMNNPRWRLHAYGPLPRLVPGLIRHSPFYVLLMTADDPAETDGDPMHDGNPGSPGSGMLLLRAEAFGPGGSHSALEATVVRDRTAPPDTPLRVVSWRTAS